MLPKPDLKVYWYEIIFLNKKIQHFCILLSITGCPLSFLLKHRLREYRRYERQFFGNPMWQFTLKIRGHSNNTWYRSGGGRPHSAHQGMFLCFKLAYLYLNHAHKAQLKAQYGSRAKIVVRPCSRCFFNLRTYAEFKNFLPPQSHERNEKKWGTPCVAKL